MSKKKKKFRAQLAQQLQQIQQNTANDTNDNTPKKNPAINKKTEAIDKIDLDQANDKFVKKEIAQIIFAVIICMIILVGIWVLDKQTSYINDFSNWLTRILHVGGGH